MVKDQLKLTKFQIEHINSLARIRSGAKETQRIKKQLLATLRLVNFLNQLDTTSISSLSQVAELENVWRKDKVISSLPAKTALSNASDQYNDFFKTKPIFDKF